MCRLKYVGACVLFVVAAATPAAAQSLVAFVGPASIQNTNQENSVAAFGFGLEWPVVGPLSVEVSYQRWMGSDSNLDHFLTDPAIISFDYQSYGDQGVSLLSRLRIWSRPLASLSLGGGLSLYEFDVYRDGAFDRRTFEPAPTVSVLGTLRFPERWLLRAEIRMGTDDPDTEGVFTHIFLLLGAGLRL